MPAKQDHIEGTHGEPYLHELLTIFLTLDAYNAVPTPAALAPAKERIGIIRDKAPADLVWADVYDLEALLLVFLPDDRLPRRLASIRREYQSMVSAGQYAQYLASGPPDITLPATTVPAMLADAQEMQAELHWIYTVRPAAEDQRKRLTRTVLVSMLLVCATIRGVDWYFDQKYLLWGICGIAGAFGAFFSAQQRIQGQDQGSSALVNLFGGKSIALSMMLAPVVGALSGMLLGMVFCGGLLQGALFPKVGSTAKDGVDLFASVTLAAKNCTELGKLIVWVFLAGYAERLVPDTLDRLMSQSEKAAKESAA